MGDVTLYLLIDRPLTKDITSTISPSCGSGGKNGGTDAIALPSSSSSLTSSPPDFHFESIIETLPADSSLAELMDVILSKITLSNNAPVEQDETANENKTFRRRHDVLNRLTILDVSYNPPKVISPVIRTHVETTGPLSKTLQSMGWYPSGKLVILPSPQLSKRNEEVLVEEHELLEKFMEWQGRNMMQHEEFAYNQPKQQNQNSNGDTATDMGGVQWIGVGASQNNDKNNDVKPSDIFNAVEQRFKDDAAGDNISSINQTKNKNSRKQRTTRTAKEKERCQRLDAYLQNLQALDNKKDSKQKKVTQKVRSMLLKSRSEGNKKLKMEDRFHLEIILLFDDGDSYSGGEGHNNDKNVTSYRFFSRVTTTGRVASTVAPSLGNDRAVEFLVSVPRCSSGRDKGGEGILACENKKILYKRLPNTMPLHEAQSAGWIQEFDVVVVRVYKIESEGGGDEDNYCGPSKSVLDPDSEEDEHYENADETNRENINANNDNIDTSTTVDVIMSEGGESNTPEMASNNGNDTTSTLVQQTTQQSQHRLQQRIQKAFRQGDDSQNSDNVTDKPSKKKKKPVSKQVQNMLMKSKARGNTIIKQEDRVYLDVVIFHDGGNGSSDGDASQSTSSPSSSYRFFSRLNDIRHVLETTVKEDTNRTVEFIVCRPGADGGGENHSKAYRALSPVLKLNEALNKGYIENFDRILIRTRSNCAVDGGLACEMIE